MNRVGVLDLGVGSVLALERALRSAAVPSRRVRDPQGLRDVSHLLLPDARDPRAILPALAAMGLMGPLLREVQDGIPLLAVGAGLHALVQEGDWDGAVVPGLGLFPGPSLPLPEPGFHRGWNFVSVQGGEALLPEGGEWFHFAHGRWVDCPDPGLVLATADLDGILPAVLGRGHLWGVQFQPEKSQWAGLDLLRRFAAVPSPRSAG
jgi:glutamine amidotransferase